MANNDAVSKCLQQYSPSSPEFGACLAAANTSVVAAPPGSATDSSTPSANAGSWSQWINPQTIAAGATTISAIAGLAQKTPNQKDMISVCGRKPLLNINGSKDKYQACVNNYMAMKNQPVYIPTAQSGSNNTMIIGLLVLLVIIALIITVVVVKRTPAAAAPTN